MVGALAVIVMLPEVVRATSLPRHGHDATIIIRRPCGVRELPPDRKILVDVSNVFDFYLGRDVTPAEHSTVLRSRRSPVRRPGGRQDGFGPTIARGIWGRRFSRSIGRRDDELADYVKSTAGPALRL